MNWRKWFLFSSRERKGMIALMLLMPITYSFPYWYEFLRKDEAMANLDDMNDYLQNNKLNDTLAAKADSIHRLSNVFKDVVTKESNTAASNISKTIIAYGQRKPYHQGDQALENKQFKQNKNNYNSNKNYTTYYQQPPKSTRNIPLRSIDINTASAELLQELPGIGPVISARIIKFREKIGGFKNLEQFGKTYGLSDSLFTIIKPFLVIHPSTG